MGDVLTLHVRGEGGAEWDMDVPSAPHARERFEQQLEKSQLVVLVDDGTTELTAQQALTLVRGGDPDEETPAGAPPKVGAGSGAKAWLAYARSIGADVDDGMNKAELIAAVEAHQTAAGEGDGEGDED